jgi:hypothetical protein
MEKDRILTQKHWVLKPPNAGFLLHTRIESHVTR